MPPVPAALARRGDPVLLPGGARVACRDPALAVHEGIFHLFYTLVG